MEVGSGGGRAGEIDWARLWEAVQKQYAGSVHGIHYVDHWKRVERNGVMLAEVMKLGAAGVTVARLFGVLHDSQRTGDGWDREHGARAAAYARTLRGVLFELDDALFGKLLRALEGHELGRVTDDDIIGLCWDADRLDLTRLGVSPREELMSTAEGKRLARAGWR